VEAALTEALLILTAAAGAFPREVVRARFFVGRRGLAWEAEPPRERRRTRAGEKEAWPARIGDADANADAARVVCRVFRRHAKGEQRRLRQSVPAPDGITGVPSHL